MYGEKLQNADWGNDLALPLSLSDVSVFQRQLSLGSQKWSAYHILNEIHSFIYETH